MGVSLSKNYIARHTSFRCNNLLQGEWNEGMGPIVLGEGYKNFSKMMQNTCCTKGEWDLIACRGFERDEGVGWGFH